jgi:hypothetical protein
MSSGYDFGTLYGMADNTNILYPEGNYDAVVESASWGRTKDGTKGQWTVKVRTTTGEMAGKMPLTQTITVSPSGENAGRSLGIMFRHLAALGIPVPDPANPQMVINGQAPFWLLGWTEDQVAQAMVGRPVTISLKHDEYDGVTRNKIRDWRPPRPGAPTDWPREQQPQPPYGAQPGYPPQPGYPQAPQGYPQQPAPQAPQQWQPPQQPAQPPWQQPAYPQAGAPLQPPAQAQPPVPGAPPWAQPQQPGQPGTGQFTAEGMAQPQPPAQQPPAAPQPPWAQQQPQQPQQGAPQPPWAAQQPPANGQPQYPAQQPQGPGEQPEKPPWAQ